MTLAEKITRQNSWQTYLTIKWLVDPPLKEAAFRTYAYFRWLDDEIDLECDTKEKRSDLIKRQRKIVETDQLKENDLIKLKPEEKLLAEILVGNRRKDAKFISYVQNFIAIIEFDAKRRNKLVSATELAWYSHTLSKAVTDGIAYFIDCNSTQTDSADRYRAGIGTHLAHMLRDYCQDIENGYINIPKEYLDTHKLMPSDIDNPLFRLWVKDMVRRARMDLARGRKYIATNVPGFRSKIAAYWYCCHYDGILDQIERDEFRLRVSYPNINKLDNYLRIIKSVVIAVFEKLSE
jgi:phytoene/squalene synthetase